MSHHRNQEEFLGDTIGDAFTDGWYSAGKGLRIIMLKMFSTSSLALMHHRFGTAFITWSTLYWNVFLMGIFTLLSHGVSRTIFKYHMILVIAAFIYHIFESRSNLRNHKKGKRRHSLFLGDSMLWVPFQKLLSALKANSVLDKLSEYHFVKWIEPGFCVLIGFLLIGFGLASNGFFLLISGLSILQLIRHSEKMDFRAKQELWDAREEGQVLEVDEPPRQQGANRATRHSAHRPH